MDMQEFSRLQREKSLKEFSDIVIKNSEENRIKHENKIKEFEKNAVIKSKKKDEHGTWIEYRERKKRQ